MPSGMMLQIDHSRHSTHRLQAPNNDGTERDAWRARTLRSASVGQSARGGRGPVPRPGTPRPSSSIRERCPPRGWHAGSTPRVSVTSPCLGTARRRTRRSTADRCPSTGLLEDHIVVVAKSSRTRADLALPRRVLGARHCEEVDGTVPPSGRRLAKSGGLELSRIGGCIAMSPT